MIWYGSSFVYNVGTSFMNNISLGSFLEFVEDLVSVLISEIQRVRNC